MNAALAILAQLTITVSAPDTITLRDYAEVSVVVTSPSARSPLLTRPSFAPFLLVRSSSAQRLESGGPDGPYVVAEYRYGLAPTREGRFVIQPFVASASGARARSQPVVIVVRGAPAGVPAVPAIVARAQLDTSAAVNFRALAVPETVYVGQQSTYQVAAFFDQSVRGRLRRNPEFYAPEMRGMLAYDLPLHLPLVPERMAGPKRYEAHVYQRALFPLAPGRYAIPPAQLIYAVPLSSSFFSREESYELRSDSAVIVAIEPPVHERPPGFAGAVGALRLSARLDTVGARVGNPLALTVRVSGSGNIKLLPRPAIQVPWASLVEADERVTVDPDPTVVRGTKEFYWILTPRESGSQEFPAVSYPFFNPATDRYEFAVSAPESLRVAPGSLARLDSAELERANRLPLRTRYRGEVQQPPYTARWFWLLVGLAPVPALVLGAAVRPRGSRARRRSVSAARALRGLARVRAGTDDVRRVRRLYVRALAERLGAAPGDLATRGAVARVARRAGASPDTANSAETLLAELDAAAYGVACRPCRDPARRADQILRALDRESRPADELQTPRRAGLPLRLLLPMLIAGGAATLPALQADDERARFARGVFSYDEGRFAQAAREFAWVAERAPRAPDAWVNFGTAWWAAGDTARAVLGWGRALRLEPLAKDARERLELAGSPTRGVIAAVPPVPAAPLVLLAAALWIGGWLAWPLAGALRRAGGRPLGLALGAAALLVGATGLAIDAKLAARDLGVVARGVQLRVLPVLASERAGVLHSGDVARVTRRSGQWAHVRADGDREGWIESALLLPLRRD